MVVDKTRFQELVKNKVKEAVEKTQLEADKKIIKAEEVFDRDRSLVAGLVKDFVSSSSSQLQQTIRQDLRSLSLNEITPQQFQDRVEQLLAQQQEHMNLLWTNSLFSSSSSSSTSSEA